MKANKVRLYIRIRRADGKYAYVDPVWNRNGSLRASYGLVGGVSQHHPEGTYYLRFLRGRKRVWESLGRDADVALVALRNKEHDFTAAALGWSQAPLSSEIAAPAAATRLTLKEARSRLQRAVAFSFGTQGLRRLYPGGSEGGDAVGAIALGGSRILG